MKVIIPNFPEPDSFVDSVAFTLKAMGHEVVTPLKKLGRSQYTSLNIAREFWHKTFPQHWTPAEKWVVATARQSPPDLVLCLTQSLRQEVLEELRKCGSKRLVAWWGDTPANMRGLGLLAKGWDFIFIKDAAAVAKFRAVGLEAELLHEAMNPAWHKRSFKTIGQEVVVAGNYYGYRQYLVARLLDADVPMALHGSRPPLWAEARVKKAYSGRYVIKEEKSEVFGAGLACLNSTSLSEGNSLNCRAFEIAGACGLQLIENKPAIAECFEPRSEVLTYSSVDEIIDHLQRARSDQKWAMNVRQAGFARANAHHTYEIRLDYLLKRVDLTKGTGS